MGLTTPVAIIAVQNELIADVLSIALEETVPGLAVLTCEDPAHLEGLLLRNPGACAVISAEKDSSETLHDLAELTTTSTLLVLDDPPRDRSGAFAPKSLIYLGPEPSLRSLVARVEKALRLESPRAAYFKITAERFQARGPVLRSDVFIRGENGQYLRIFRAGERVGKADFDRELAKNQATYLYLVRNDYLDSLEEIFSTTSVWMRALRRLGRVPLLRTENHLSREDLLIRLAFEDLSLLVLVSVAMVYILQFSLNQPMEPPFLGLGPGAFVINAWLALAVLLPWSLIFDARALSVLALAATGAFARFNFRKVMELGKPISFFDMQHLYMSGVLKQYMGAREVLAVIFFLSVPLVLRFSVSRVWKRRRTWTVTFLYFVALSAVFDGFFLFVCLEPFRRDSFLQKRFPKLPDPLENASAVGYPLSVLLGISRLSLPPDSFAPVNAAAFLGAKAEPAGAPGDGARSVVLVLLESFRDYSLDGILFRKDVLPFYHHLKARSKVARFYSPSVGGGTANVGFEVISGMPTAFFPGGGSVYEKYLDHFVPTLTSRFKNAGYLAYAVHNQSGENYQRNHVYPMLGFDHFYDKGQLEDELGPMPGERYPDRAVFEKSLRLLDSRERQFQYLITYETHGPYDESAPAESWVNDPTLNDNRTLVASLDTYSDRMNKLDKDLEWYFAELAKRKNPPIVVLFGDHHPSMSLQLPFSQRDGDHVVEGVLALGGSQGAELYDGGKPIFCLPPLILDEAGVRATRYFRYLEQFCRSRKFYGPLRITTANEKEVADLRSLVMGRLQLKGELVDPAEAAPKQNR